MSQQCSRLWSKQPPDQNSPWLYHRRFPSRFAFQSETERLPVEYPQDAFFQHANERVLYSARLGCYVMMAVWAAGDKAVPTKHEAGGTVYGGWRCRRACLLCTVQGIQESQLNALRYGNQHAIWGFGSSTAAFAMIRTELLLMGFLSVCQVPSDVCDKSCRCTVLLHACTLSKKVRCTMQMTTHPCKRFHVLNGATPPPSFAQAEYQGNAYVIEDRC